MQNYREAKRLTPDAVQIIVAAAAIGEEESEKPITIVKDAIENEGGIFLVRNAGANTFSFDINDDTQKAQLLESIEGACPNTVSALQQNPQATPLHAVSQEEKHPHWSKFKQRLGSFAHHASRRGAEDSSLYPSNL